MRPTRLAPWLSLLLFVSPVGAEPRVIGRTESNVRVLRGGATAPDSLGFPPTELVLPTMPEAAAPVGKGGGGDAVLTGPAPRRTAPEALALARSMVTAFGGKPALQLQHRIETLLDFFGRVEVGNSSLQHVGREHTVDRCP